MKVLSLFSGVGGFDLGLENAGMETVFQCEWDKHATKILERHWPDVPRWGDISTLTGRHILDHAPVIDVVAWGSPCQDLSVAGKRAGLKGERSGLFHEGIRIIKEIRELTNGQYPRISIWENVAGALSSGAGADFGQVLYEMDEAGACFSEWRLLDAQYFGVPQRRRRVFVVSVFDSATAARCPNPLLPVSESVCWNPATSRTTRQESAGTVEQSPQSGGGTDRTYRRVTGALLGRDSFGPNHEGARDGKLILETTTEETEQSFGNSGFQRWTETETAITLSARDHKSSNTIVVGSLAARDYKGVGNQYVQEGKLVVEPFVKAKRAQTATDDETWVEGDINPTINQFDQGDVRATTAIVMRQREGKPGGGKGPLLSEDKSLTLAANCNDQTLFVEEPMLLDGRRVDDVRVYEPPVQTLQERMGTGGNNVPVIGFSHTQGLSAQPSELAWPTLRTEGAGMAVAYDEYNDRLGGDVHHALRAGTKQSTGVIEPTMAVRRLTPLECERLMGWPDNWTAGQSDTHRYKQCGNGVASPVAQWIGEQIINL